MKKKIILCVTVFFIVIGALVAYRYYYLLTRNLIDEMIVRKRMINILVAGSNVFNDNRHRFHGIISVNPENKRAGFTFLPPDMVLEMSSRANETKKIQDIDISDFSTLRDALSRNLKLNVNFFVEIYAVDVERMVDLVRGLDMFVLDQLPKGGGYEFGLNYFDGKKTVNYINHSSGSIFKKYDRIQDIILSINGNRENYRSLINPQFITETMKSLKTNMMPQEVYSLAGILSNISEVSCIVLPGDFDDRGDYHLDNISYKIYEKEFLTQLLVDEQNTASLKVKILNGTNIPGLARKMRNLLIREGLNVVEFGTSPYPHQDHSILVNQRGTLTNTKKISEVTGISKVYHVIDNTQLHDVLLILGMDNVKSEESTIK